MIRRLLVASVGIALSSCAPPPGPSYPSSAEQAGYAERYPETLRQIRSRYAEDETAVREQIGRYPKFSDDLRDPDFTVVRVAVERAAESGKSADFVNGMAEVEQVQGFFEGEKEALSRRIGGAVSYAAKQKQCDVELYGPTAMALDKAVEKQLTDRIRSRNDGQRIIDEHEEALKKPNLEKLREKLDEVAHTSYLVSVRLPRAKSELEGLLRDASDVGSTLDRVRAEAKTVLDDPNASKPEKESARGRDEAAQKARSELDSEVDQARRALSELEERTSRLASEHQKALDALLSDLEKRGQAQAH